MSAASGLAPLCAFLLATGSGYISGFFVARQEAAAATQAEVLAPAAAPPQACQCDCTWRVELPSVALPLELGRSLAGAAVAFLAAWLWSRWSASAVSPFRRPSVLSLR